jgi:transmembrane protein 222
VYSRRMHNICCDNCHSHVAKCLSLMNYGGTRNYGMIKIGVWFFFCGQFTDFAGFLKTFTPFLIVVAVIVVASIFG